MGKTLVGAGYLTLQNVTDILDKGGGQCFTKLYASTKNVALQLQGADQSNQNYFQFFLQTFHNLSCYSSNYKNCNNSGLK